MTLDTLVCKVPAPFVHLLQREAHIIILQLCAVMDCDRFVMLATKQQTRELKTLYYPTDAQIYNS